MNLESDLMYFVVDCAGRTLYKLPTLQDWRKLIFSHWVAGPQKRNNHYSGALHTYYHLVQERESDSSHANLQP